MGSERTNGTALDTVIIFTHQMEAMVRFYKDGLGLGPFESSPGHCGCYCGAVYFGFDQIDEHNEPRNSTVMPWFTVEDLPGMCAHLAQLGGRIKSPPDRKPWGGYLASVYDIDGNVIGLSQKAGG